MTRKLDPSDPGDTALDALVRAASERETDEPALYQSVLGRLDPEEHQRLTPIFWPFSSGLAAAGFAALFLTAGLGGYVLPDLAFTDPETQILAIAMGEVDDPVLGGLAEAGQ